MLIEIAEEKNYVVRPGVYRAVLLDIRPVTKYTDYDSKDQIRLTFEIPGYFKRKRNQTIVFKNLDQGGMVTACLEKWLGREFIEQNQVDGRLDLDKCLGRLADLKVSNIRNRNHKNPFTIVDEIAPPGTFVPLDTANHISEGI
jgi:hypothetical protein